MVYYIPDDWDDEDEIAIVEELQDNAECGCCNCMDCLGMSNADFM